MAQSVWPATRAVATASPIRRALGAAVWVATATVACSAGLPPPPTPKEPADSAPNAPSARLESTSEPSPASTGSEPLVPTQVAEIAPHPAADLFAGLPTGDAQRQRLCRRGHADHVAQMWCREGGATITGLVELQRQLGIAYDQPGLHTRMNMSGNGRAGNPAFAFLGHSTSLMARLVSPINPRVIVFSPPANGASSDYVPPEKFQKDPRFVALAFTRGEQIVELIDRDPIGGDLRFFVLRYEQACNDRPGGCDNYDLFTPATETDWLRVSLYDDSDLENTPGDCNVCHQPDGHGTPRKLLMQAQRTPWTHYFRNNREGGLRQIWRYQQAHAADEAYAGIAGSDVRFSDPQLLEGLVENEGFMAQPISLHAYWQKWGVPAAALAANPELSSTWKRERGRALLGMIPAVPFVVVDFVDEERMQRAAQAYREVMAGRAERDHTPDLADMHRADVLSHVSLAPPADADGRTILMSMCRRCHNPTRNPGSSRARFDVDRLDTLPTIELLRARQRLRSPPRNPGHMPPARFGRLTPLEVARIEQSLDLILATRKSPR